MDGENEMKQRIIEQSPVSYFSGSKQVIETDWVFNQKPKVWLHASHRGTKTKQKKQSIILYSIETE